MIHGNMNTITSTEIGNPTSNSVIHGRKEPFGFKELNVLPIVNLELEFGVFVDNDDEDQVEG